jgi:hypothetical protein
MTRSGHTTKRADHSTSSSASKSNLLENLARVLRLIAKLDLCRRPLKALFEKQPKNQCAEIDHFVMAITPGVELAQALTTTQGWRHGHRGQVLGPALLRCHGEKLLRRCAPVRETRFR